MDPSINRPGTQVTTVTKEKGDATDERPHYVRVRESAPLSEGQFPNKPHLTEHAFLFLLGTRSPSANPPTLFCWVGDQRSCGGQVKDSEVRSELGASTSDWPLLWVTEAVSWTKKRLSVVEKKTTNRLLQSSDKSGAVQRWQSTMERFEKRRWGELSLCHKHLIVKANSVIFTIYTVKKWWGFPRLSTC